MEYASLNNNYHYNYKLKAFAKANRQNMSKSEASLWKYVLSSGIMIGYKFQRHRPILNYITDFFCKELLPVIEVDGISHDDEKHAAKDKKRDLELLAIGITTIRFSD